MLVPKNIGRYGRYNVPLLAQGMGLYELLWHWIHRDLLSLRDTAKVFVDGVFEPGVFEYYSWDHDDLASDRDGSAAWAYSSAALRDLVKVFVDGVFDPDVFEEYHWTHRDLDGGRDGTAAWTYSAAALGSWTHELAGSSRDGLVFVDGVFDPGVFEDYSWDHREMTSLRDDQAVFVGGVFDPGVFADAGWDHDWPSRASGSWTHDEPESVREVSAVFMPGVFAPGVFGSSTWDRPALGAGRDGAAAWTTPSSSPGSWTHSTLEGVRD